MFDLAAEAGVGKACTVYCIFVKFGKSPGYPEFEH